jgi:transcriptional regulator with XRE-family HTH domain
MIRFTHPIDPGAAMYEQDAISVDIAKRLKDLREERRMSMRDLAVRSGLSANAISTIEAGKVSPSVSTLYKIAEAMSVPVTAFFSQKTDKSKMVFIKAGERTRLPFQRGTWEGLGGVRFVGRVEPFLLTLENGGSSGPNPMVHTGHEFVFCLRGRFEYEVEGRVFPMEAGDSLLFAAHLEHRWRNTSDTVANALIILSDFSEGDHPSILHMAERYYPE